MKNNILTIDLNQINIDPEQLKKLSEKLVYELQLGQLNELKHLHYESLKQSEQ